MSYKIVTLRYLTILGLFLMASFSLHSQNLGFRSIVVESFDGAASNNHPDGAPITWSVTGSSYTLEDYPRMLFVPEQWPLDLFGDSVDTPETYQVLGINGSFKRPEINQIFITPGTGEGDEWAARPISLSGFVQSLDLWVWGSNLEYTMQVDLEDANGLVSRHYLYQQGKERLQGSLRFLGWKNLYLNIGNSVYQHLEPSGTIITNDNSLKVVKFIITTPINAPVNNFYIYLDHLSIITDTQFDKFYDGYKLGTSEKALEIWGADVPGEGPVSSAQTPAPVQEPEPVQEQNQAAPPAGQ